MPFSRRIQQLSLMLDAQGRRNLNAYIDRYEKILLFLKARSSVFSELRLPGAASTIGLRLEFEPLLARQLQSKTYVFGNGRQSRSQFTGLRDHGPLHPLNDNPRILFMFREQDRAAARTLAIALRGLRGKEKFSFPGFQALFKSEFVIDGNPVVLPDLTDASMAGAVEAVKSRKASGESFLPVLVLPEGDDNGYLAHKADFSHAGIPSQVCTLRVIQDEYSLKWAIANIALQVFCKAGGQPWKVRPSSEPTLIIGISQSHKLKEINRTRTVEKYFAFSVMTDNSGLFQSIQVLGDSGSQSEYLKQLRSNLKAALVEGSQKFARVVVHTSFKLKRDEIDAIQKTVNDFATGPDGEECRFAVVKVNHKCRFFGVNRRVNSLVPYEGSTIRLGAREYLVWFEGIFPDKPTVTKAFPGPTHLQFLCVSEGAGISDADLLQDIVNLSGANWRGFNAKSRRFRCSIATWSPTWSTTSMSEGCRSRRFSSSVPGFFDPEHENKIERHHVPAGRRRECRRGDSDLGEDDQRDREAAEEGPRLAAVHRPLSPREERDLLFVRPQGHLRRRGALQHRDHGQLVVRTRAKRRASALPIHCGLEFAIQRTGRSRVRKRQDVSPSDS